MKIRDRVQRVPETFGETEEIRDRNRKRKARRRAYDGTVMARSRLWILSSCSV